MKKLLPYIFFAAVLALCLAAVGTPPERGVRAGAGVVLRSVPDSAQEPDEGQAKQYFTAAEAVPGSAAGRIQTSRVPASVFKSAGGDAFSKLKMLFSRRTHSRFQIVATTYSSYYSRKEKDGYYIYALRKLLI